MSTNHSTAAGPSAGPTTAESATADRAAVPRPADQAPGAQPSPVGSEGPLLLTPTERLQLSRERMAQWMIRADGRHIARRRAAAAGEPDRWSWLGKLRDNAAIAFVIDAVGSWWETHPLHGAVDLAANLARDAVAPLAKRHPRALVASAVVVGAVLAWTRPWRWLAKPAVFTGLLTQLGSHLVAQVPFESILNAINAFAERRHSPADAAAASAQASASPAPTTAQPST